MRETRDAERDTHVHGHLRSQALPDGRSLSAEPGHNRPSNLKLFLFLLEQKWSFVSYRNFLPGAKEVPG